ncbi:unnamed protein product [Moneuplotes crassus]|uniref:Uncharacterized protein n=1 Tax=Euplotes crassus TaxID=5936 RepID=A0AAD1XAK2_EUPCR|nr:unnamed protein product [Moneuplotes crassus]
MIFKRKNKGITKHAGKVQTAKGIQNLIPSKLCALFTKQDLKTEMLMSQGGQLRSQQPTEEIKELSSFVDEQGISKTPIKMGRPRKFPESGFYTKNMRLDILNKNLLRGVKRHLVGLFRLFCINSGLFQYESLSQDLLQLQRMKFEITDDLYEQAMQGFVPYFLQLEAFGTDSSACQTLGDSEKLKELLTVFIDPSKSLDTKFPGTEKLLKREFHGMLYAYSHIKLERFLVLPEMRLLLAKMLSGDSLTKVLSTNQTLSMEEDIYRKCAEMILEKAQKHEQSLVSNDL